MSENFRPLFGVESPDKPDEFKDEVHKLLEEKKLLEEEVRSLESRLKTIEEENRQLLEELKKIREELSQKNSRIEELVSELVDARLKKVLAEKLTANVERALRNAKEELRNEFIGFSKEVIKEFLMTDAVPKEEIITRVLGDVFEGLFELKGSVKVFLNPADMDKVFEFIASIKEKLGDRVDIEVLGDESLQPGELRIETPKFVIERKHDEIIGEVIEEVLKRVFEGS
ncbi:FliH/SctL family protein [Hydrogenivirga sp.]